MKMIIKRLHSAFAGDGLKSSLFRAATGSASLRIAGMGFGFLVGVQLARGLGAEGYGTYGLAMSIIALLTVPTEFGFPQLLTREIATAQVQQDWGRVRGIIRWSSRMSLLISVVIGACVIAWQVITDIRINTQLGMTLLAGVALVPVVAQLSLRAAALRGLQQIVRGQLPSVLLRPGFYSLLLFIVPLWVMPLTPALAMGLGVMSSVVAMMLAFHMLRRALPSEARVADAITDARSWWSSALPMAMTEGMRLLQSHLLILLLGAMVVMADVGVYRMASSMMLLLAMPISLFNIVSMPIIARLHAKGDVRDLQRLLGMTAAGMTLGALFLCIPFFVAGKWILGRVFGPEFTAGNSALLILALSVLTNAVFGTAANLLNMTGHQGDVTRASLVSMLCLAATAVPLVHFIGIEGAALSHFASTLVWNLYMWFAVKSRLSLDSGLLSLFLARRGKRA